MPIDASGRWRPTTSPKQDYLRQICRHKKFVLANGPRYSGKTVGALQCLCEHAWLTNRANICIITISQTVGMDSGVWNDLTGIFLPEWIGGNFGMKWVEKPFIQGVSKKPTCIVSNRFGGESTIQLESLKNEQEVEDRFKPRRYSMIYVPELSTFHNRGTFVCWTECLRMIGMPEKDHLFLADTNPPDDESWWIHDLWWDLLEAEADALEPEQRMFKDALSRVDINVEDNPFADPRHVTLLKAKYAHDEELYNRYILGLPTKTTEDSLFHKVFRPKFHVIGEVSSPANQDPEILVPQPECRELSTGWDPGSATNSAAVIAEKWKPLDTPGRLTIINFLDELVLVDELHTLDDFVLAFMRKMEMWELIMGLPGKVTWNHWSDRSVFDMRSPESNRYYHEIIYDASLRYIEEELVHVSGPIILQAADRGPGSVEQRVDLWKRMLYDERAFFSAEKCPKLIHMNKSIKRSKTAVGVIQKGSPHKHVFDAASYLQSSECYDELAKQVMANLKRVKQKESSVVSVAY